MWNHHVCSVWHNACIKHCEHVSTSPICFMYVWITQSDNYEFNCVLYSFFSVWLLSVLRGHSVFSSPPQRPMTSNFEGFSIPDFIHCILFSYLNFWERASIFPFECSVLNKDTSSTIFITSFVWRGPWLGIETGASRTRSQHYTTRLSRRPCLKCVWNQMITHVLYVVVQ